MKQGEVEQRRKSGREESDKQVNDRGNSALKWKGVKKDKGAAGRERTPSGTRVTNLECRWRAVSESEIK